MYRYVADSVYMQTHISTDYLYTHRYVVHCTFTINDELAKNVLVMRKIVCLHSSRDNNILEIFDHHKYFLE